MSFGFWGNQEYFFMKTSLNNKNIVLAVCGGIAAYKSIELLRLLRKYGADVKVIMTRSAAKFVGPLTFETLSGNPVCISLFDKRNRGSDSPIVHIDLAEEADAVIIAPATANIIGKLACGIADDALSTFILALTSPVIICPSMNSYMYVNRAVQRNLQVLKNDGYHVLEPGLGELACGTKGPGRLPEPDVIIDRLLTHFAYSDFKGTNLLVTAGPTREPIDPVRFISNPSSGKMGYAIARAAEQRGANVTLITGPTSLPELINVNTVRVQTAEQMAAAVFDHLSGSNVIIKTAAVSDYRPKVQAKHKIKKKKEELVLYLQKNIDILKELGTKKNGRILVGFAAETEELEKNAEKKLSEKNLDIIVGNLVGIPSSGFNSDTNKVTLFYKDGTKEILPVLKKDEVANILLDRVLKTMEKDKPSAECH